MGDGHVKLTAAAYAKVELFGKDNDLSMKDAASQIIMSQVDALAAQVIRENSNCFWDLYELKEGGEKDFSCPIKRQRPDLRAGEKMDVLNETFCGQCPRMKLIRELFKLDKHLDPNKSKPVKPAPSSAPAAIKEELAKDTAEPKPVVKPPESPIPPLRANYAKYYVRCDNGCGFEIYNDNSAAKASDELTDHAKNVHKRELTTNEINQLKMLNRAILQDVQKVIS